jgi:hypothetical protein
LVVFTDRGGVKVDRMHSRTGRPSGGARDFNDFNDPGQHELRKWSAVLKSAGLQPAM